MIEPGTHVICICATPPACGWPPLLPVQEGQQYVIRDTWRDNAAGWLVQLTGMPDDPTASYGGPCGYSPERFRRVDDLKAEARRAAELTEQAKQIGLAKQPLVSKGELKEITP